MTRSSTTTRNSTAPMAPNPEKKSSAEDRIILAANAFHARQFRSIRAAALAYDVPHSTLSHRLRGRHARLAAQVMNLKLLTTEETALVQWILSMDERGQSPTLAYVRRMADLLVSKRGSDASHPPVGECWVQRFLRRHPELKTKYCRKYDYQRALCENPKLLQTWFDRIRDEIAKHGISEEDIYNFDETGFQMGVAATAKVVTRAERTRLPTRTQPGNRSWVSVI